MDTYLPPKYSLNSFFVRHVAHPRRMKYISGLGNAKICSVNDVGYINYNNSLQQQQQQQHHQNNGAHSSMSNALQRLEFPPNNFNEELLKSDSLLFKRRERAVPPNGMWNTFGLIDNTEKWRSQLNSLASSVGLLTQNDLEEMRRKKDRDEMIKSYQFRSAPRVPQSATGSNRAQSAVAKIKSPANRLNEPLPSRNRTSRQSRGASSSGTGYHKSSQFNKHYVIDSAEREVWMLQVLCQILQTDSLTDVQSWLVSTSDQEKERVKQLIDQAMRGLEESGRITEQNHNISNNVDQLPKTNQQQQHNQYQNTNDQEQQNQSSLTYIENVLQKIDLNKQPHMKGSKTKYANKTNVLKLDDMTDNINPNLSSIKLDPIPEASKPSQSDFYDNNEEQNLGDEEVKEGRKEDLTSNSATFSINMHATSKQQQSHRKKLTKNILSKLDNAIFKLETPSSSKDFKIEQVKVTMLVKDQESNSLQEITGDWKSNNN